MVLKIFIKVVVPVTCLELFINNLFIYLHTHLPTYISKGVLKWFSVVISDLTSPSIKVTFLFRVGDGGYFDVTEITSLA